MQPSYPAQQYPPQYGQYPGQPATIPQQYQPQAAPQQYPTPQQGQPQQAPGGNPFVAPAPAPTGDRLKAEEMAGKRFVIVPVAKHPGFFPGRPVPNTNPPAMTLPSDAIECDVMDIDSGQTWLGVMFGQKMFVGTLEPMIGQMVLSTVRLGVARGGNNAPWLLDGLSGDAGAVQAGKRALEAKPAWRDRAAHAQQAPAHHGTQQSMPQWAQPAPQQQQYAQQGYGQPAPAQQYPNAQQFAPGFAPTDPFGAPPAQQFPTQPQAPAPPPGMDPAAWPAYWAMLQAQQAGQQP